MKVELLARLKGKETWEKGLILDSEEAPLPPDILGEIKHGTKTVRVIEGDPEEMPVSEDTAAKKEVVPEKAEEAGTIEKEWVCEICGKGFKSIRALKGHMLGAHKK